MENKEKHEELQSRRDFFKKAAKTALPILGAIVLSSTPLLSQAHESQNEMGCSYCKDTCLASCRGTCNGECKGACKYECTGGCKSSCSGRCKHGCTSSSS